MSYSEALSAAGCEVLEYVEFGSYQGEWFALIRKDGEIGVCEGSYGSCSYCDAFESEFGDVDENSDDYEKRLAEFGETYLPANTILEMIEKVNKDIVRNSWYADEYEELLTQLKQWEEEYNK